MKLTSFNVNGIRAVLKKTFTEDILELDPDILCLQETKARPEQVELPLELAHYKTYWNSAQKAGYSSTAIFTKEEPISVTNDMGIDVHDQEGRVIAAEYEKFILVTVYTPNSKSELERLDYRQVWDRDFLAYLKELEKKKPLLVCGDLNVAHKEIDLARPATNHHSAGFTDEERQGFDNLMTAGFTDTFRHFHPNAAEEYSWWSYRAGARARNVGWRIDYWLSSPALKDKLTNAYINQDILGSDHCPVTVEVDF